MALDDSLVGADTARHVVGLDGQNFLEGVSRAVGLQSPHFHLTEPLAAELGFAAQGLLGNQRVGTGGPGMDLVVNQMVQLQEVDIADGDLVIKGLAGTARRTASSCPPGSRPASCRASEISLSVAPSKMGVATFQPSAWAA